MGAAVGLSNFLDNEEFCMHVDDLCSLLEQHAKAKLAGDLSFAFTSPSRLLRTLLA